MSNSNKTTAFLGFTPSQEHDRKFTPAYKDKLTFNSVLAFLKMWR